MNQPVLYLSPNGIRKLEERLATQREAHAQICHEREVAHELSGDGWHDNPHFNYLQQMEANSSWKIHELEEQLSSARCFEIQENARPTNRVELGSVVRCVVIDLETDEERERVLEIMGYGEGEPSLNQVSYQSPFGKALMGLSVNDFHETRLPQGEVAIEVLELYASRAEALS